MVNRPPQRPHGAATRPRRAASVAGLMLLACPVAGFSWGDQGHEITALIAEHYLTPAVRAEVASLLAGDSSGLTRTTGLAAEATWADKFRDSDRDTEQLHYRQTRAWHYIDIELDRPDLDAACFQHPALAPGSQASEGPADDCILDKIEQFRSELHSVATPLDERRRALQFLLHLVGDLHQPLHAADNHDHGGNDLLVKTATNRAGNLHHYWDTVFVERLGARADAVAARLIAGISAKQRRTWSSGSPTDWARQSFDIARVRTYGKLPRSDGDDSSRHPRDVLMLDADYEAEAEITVAIQLQRAGLRLARLLNDALR
ncbi:MAG: S1/P1 nuclease [Steroidobacteraceae bacterium]